MHNTHNLSKIYLYDNNFQIIHNHNIIITSILDMLFKLYLD